MWGEMGLCGVLEHGECEIGDVGSPTLALSAARDDENASRSS